MIVILTEVGEGVNRGSERSLKEVGFELRLEGWQGLLFFFFNSPHNALGIVHACVRADRARIRTLAYLTIKMFRIIKILRISLLHSGPIYFASFKNDCIF